MTLPCIMLGCARPQDSHGLCCTHRYRAIRLGVYGDLAAHHKIAPTLDALWTAHRAKAAAKAAADRTAGKGAERPAELCIVPECPARAHARKFCCTHDKRARALGIEPTAAAYAKAAPTLDARWAERTAPLPPTAAGVEQAARPAPADVVLPYQLPTAPKPPPDALEQIEQVLGLPPGESSETEVIWQVRKLRQRAEAAEAALAELRTAVDRAAADAQKVVFQLERRADHAEAKADDYRAQLRIAEEEVGRLTWEGITLRAQLAAAMAPMTQAEVERRYADLVRARRYLASATERGVVGVGDV